MLSGRIENNKICHANDLYYSRFNTKLLKTFKLHLNPSKENEITDDFFFLKKRKRQGPFKNVYQVMRGSYNSQIGRYVHLSDQIYNIYLLYFIYVPHHQQ